MNPSEIVLPEFLAGNAFQVTFAVLQELLGDVFLFLGPGLVQGGGLVVEPVILEVLEDTHLLFLDRLGRVAVVDHVLLPEVVFEGPYVWRRQSSNQ